VDAGDYEELPAALLRNTQMSGSVFSCQYQRQQDISGGEGHGVIRRTSMSEDALCVRPQVEFCYGS
jgi:hypothetical protein